MLFYQLNKSTLRKAKFHLISELNLFQVMRKQMESIMDPYNYFPTSSTFRTNWKIFHVIFNEMKGLIRKSFSGLISKT